MKYIAFAILSGLISVNAHADECAELLDPKVMTIVRPLVELRLRQHSDQFTADGRWKGQSPVSPEVERRFNAVLGNRTAEGDRAVVYLLYLYMGEHPGEELVCEVLARGPRMLPLIEAYDKCLPKTGLEPLPKGVRGSGFLPADAKEALQRGATCGRE